jgi:hypothetical protein
MADCCGDTYICDIYRAGQLEKRNLADADFSPRQANGHPGG